MTSELRRRPRRYGGAIVCLAIVLAAIGSATRPTGRALAVSGGDPYTAPAVVDTNPSPTIVETTLIAEDATVDIGNGVIANAETFNGQIPGPTFHLAVGDTVIVHYENHLQRVSGIHWHGIELSNNMDGTPFTQNQVPPGGTFLYKFKVTRPGIFWYHPHHHSSTNQVFKGLYGMIVVADPNEAALQTSGALPSAGNTYPIVLSDTTVCKAAGSNDAATYNPALPWVGGGPLPAQPAPAPVDLCETSPVDEDANARGAFAAGDIPNIQKSGGGRENEGQTVLTNGKNVGGRAGSPSAPGALANGAATLPVFQGQGIRLQLLNASAIRYMRLRLTTDGGGMVPLVRVGGEGGLLDNAVVEGNPVLPAPAGVFDTGYNAGEILIPPGSRADVVAAIPTRGTGVLTLWTEDYSRTGQGFANIPTVPVMHFSVVGSAASIYTIAAGTPLRAATGDPVPALGPATGTLLDPATFSPPKLGMPSQDIRLTSSGAPLGINGIFGTHDVVGDYTLAPHLGSTRWARLGDTLELTTTNTTSAHHPFHLHGFSMQPLSLTKPSAPTFNWPYREFRDNIDIPAGYTLRFRVKLDDRPLPDGTTPGGALGRWVFHCHIFFHATLGMLSELVVVPAATIKDGATGNERPYVNADSASVEVPEGSTATMTGTYRDPDGDPVTLTASSGTVTATGGGTWSWSRPTINGPGDSGDVYITAIDSTGNVAQAVFAVVVDNVRPFVLLSAPAAATYPQGASITATAFFTDPGAADTHTCSIAWGDLATSPGAVSESAGSGSCTGTHVYSGGGYRTIIVTVDDGDGGLGYDSVTIRFPFVHHFSVVVTPTALSSGQVLLVKATALDANGVKVAGYSDSPTLSGHTIPAPATMTCAKGLCTATVHVSGAAVADTATVSDGDANGVSNAFRVTGPVAYFRVSVNPLSVKACSPLSIGVTAFDAASQVISGFQADLTVTDRAGGVSVVLPLAGTWVKGQVSFTVSPTVVVAKDVITVASDTGATGAGGSIFAVTKGSCTPTK